MSPDDHVGPVAGLEQRVRAAVDGDEHGLEVADVGADDREILLVAGPRATTSACRSRKRVRSCGSWMPSASSCPSSRR